jgi:hypothetical protein
MGPGYYRHMNAYTPAKIATVPATSAIGNIESKYARTRK